MQYLSRAGFATLSNRWCQMNNFQVKKRPCSKSLALVGLVYFLLMVLLLLLRS